MTFTTDPIGEVQQIESVNRYVQARIAEWQEVKKEVLPKWWQFWKPGTALYAATRYCIEAMDYLIDHVEEVIPKGADKKATVLAAMSVLYDYVVRETLPLWMKPFAGKIKQILIYVVLSTMIDWIIKKYRDGEWKQGSTGEEKNGNETPQTQPQV